MATPITPREIAAHLPSWAPKETSTYLAHTEAGTPLRALAREAGVHASTIMRQVRALETRREDVLVDRLLSRLGRQVFEHMPQPDHNQTKVSAQMTSPTQPNKTLERSELTEAELTAHASRVLGKLCEPGAVMAVAADMDKAVIVCETESGDTTRRGIVDRDVAEALALKDWVACDKPGRIVRYRITRAGRNALSKFMAQAENKALGFAEAAEPFWLPDGKTKADLRSIASERAVRFQSVETPLALLARRRDKDGDLFLPSDLVGAGERLREDFELAGLSARPDEPWDSFLVAMETPSAPLAAATAIARKRVAGALRDLGPGLGDAALRCCCFLEGLEATEKRMGWSARSGKIVLRIALQRLKRHYEELGEAGAMLG